MNKAKAVTAVFLATTAIGTGTVHAATFTQHVDFGALADNSLSGAFDLTGLIANEAANGNRVSSLDSATVYLFGYSPNAPQASVMTSSNVYYFSHRCGSYSWGGSRYCGGQYTFHEYSEGDHFEDRVQLDFGANSLTATVSGTDHVTHSSSTNNAYNGYLRNYYRRATTGNDFGGTSASASLDMSALEQMLIDQKLDLIISALGQFSNSKASLSLTYSTEPLADLSAVPVPPALPLMGAGLALAAWRNGKRRKTDNGARIACF